MILVGNEVQNDVLCFAGGTSRNFRYFSRTTNLKAMKSDQTVVP